MIYISLGYIFIDGTTGKDNDLDVFISYSWDNQEEVLLIKNYLEAHKLKVWMDLQHVKGGKLLNEVLADGIQRCKVSHQRNKQ